MDDDRLVTSESLPKLLGKSRAMRDVRERLVWFAQRPWPVRLEGPTGVGKSVAARLLHLWSPRWQAPFRGVGLHALDDSLALSELFGHTRGAFTGAVRDRPGVFEAAHGGTLFLDEVGLASAAVQRALLEVIQDGTFRRVGEERARQVDVRLVFATNEDLETRVHDGTFRADLFHRMGDLVIRMPPLRERIEDLPELVDAIWRVKVDEGGPARRSLAEHDLATLARYDWPGNVRELEKALEHFIVVGSFPARIYRPGTAADWRTRLDEALSRHEGNKSAVARELNISRTTLHHELSRRRKAGDVKERASG